MRLLKISFLIALLFVFAGPSLAAEIVAMRAYEHKGFHRLTIIVSEEIALKADKEDEKVVLRMREIAVKELRELPATEAIKVKNFRQEKDAEGEYAALEVSIPAGSRVTQTVKAGPFRVILDVYPPPGFGAKKELDPHMKAVLMQQDASSVLAFNDSWRWVYRKKVSDILREGMYRDGSAEAFSASFDVDAVGKEGAVAAANGAVASLRAEGRVSDALVLGRIMDFYADESLFSTLEDDLRPISDPVIKGLGYFLLAEHFEKKGFFPEASGYYTLAARVSRKPGFRSLAEFRKARLLFFDHKYSQAKDGLKSALDAGYSGARAWLANSCLIKGEIEYAWKLFSGLSKDASGLDPVSALGLADMHLVRGNYNEARYIYASLKTRHPEDSLAGVYLALKEGDARFLEGKRAEAIELYSGIKQKLRGEPWAVASLSLADAYYVMATRDELEKAEKIYESIANGSFEGSAPANLRLIATQMVLGKFEDAHAVMERFNARHATTSMKQEMSRISSTLFYGWVNALIEKEDHLGAVKLYKELKMTMPFGKKAEMSLKIGRSFRALGLYAEAVKELDAAVKLGDRETGEEVMILLAWTYLDQFDTNSASRLIKAFGTRFPKSKRTADIERLRLEVAFNNGEYAKSASVPAGVADPSLIGMKAASLAKTGSLKEASASFEAAAVAHGGKGEKKAASGAWISAADAKFTSGDYRGAVEAYRKGLEAAAEDDAEARSWALYRLARSYSKLGMKEMEEDALTELKALGGDLGAWSEKIHEKPKRL